MDIDLKQGLGDIADDAPAAHLDPDALWRAGVRRRNRRRVGAGVAVAAVIALVAGAVGVAATPGLLRTEEPPPASARSEAALPERVWMPSAWTPGTYDAGDPGRIAVLFWDNGRRQSLSPIRRDSGGGFVSVSAVDGKYRYLDLPDLVFDSQPPALSPDGRYVAYALRSAGADEPAAVTTGWAVYDAQTGRTVRHVPRDAPKGVGQGAMAWSADSRTLLVDVCRVSQVDEASQSCETRRADAWDVATGEVREVTGALASEVVGRSGDDLLLQSGRRLESLDPRTGALTRLGRVGDSSDSGEAAAAVEPGGRVATLATVRFEGVDRADDAVEVSGDTRVQLRVTRQLLASGEADGPAFVPVRGAGQVEPLAVGDDGSVVALTYRPSELPTLTRMSRSGSSEVVRFQPGWTGALPQVAEDLLDVPTVPGVRPPDIRDPRAVSGVVAVGLAAAAGLGLVWWRRRRFREVSA